MRKLLRLIAILAIGIAGALPPRASRAQETCKPCQAFDPKCPHVEITEDNHLDHLCHASAIGQNLVDTDGDGIPDACGDRCPCVANPHDPVTGYGPCPEPRAQPPPNAAPKIGCSAEGELTGLEIRSWFVFIRPRMILFFSEKDWKDPIVSAGAHISAMGNIDDFACMNERVGDKDSVALTHEPQVYWRAGLYVDPSLTGDGTFLGADGGVDYLPSAKYWSIGGQIHLLSILQKDTRVAVNVGAGVRVGLLDALAIIPFVQIDLHNDDAFSVGTFLSLDLDLLEELGVPAKMIEQGLRNGG